MQISVLRPAAVLTSVVLAGSVVAGITPAAAESSSCVATELPLPAGTPSNVFADVTASDSSGRYQLGSLQDEQGNQTSLFWTDRGAPVVLAPLPGTNSPIDVNDKGTVLGTTRDADGKTQPWLYSHGVVRKLPVPAHLTGIAPRAINDRGDVVGYGQDPVTADSVPLVWPGGGNPQRLRASGSADAVDINEAGVVVGSTWTDAGETALVWKGWDDKPVAVTGEAGADIGLTKIRGNWFVGIQTLSDGSVIGARWNLRSTKGVSFPDILDGVNSSGDVAHRTADGTTVVSRPDGTQYAIDTVGFNSVRYLYDRGQSLDAAGSRDYGFSRAILWSGCSN
ncbi:hypothetical protein ACIA58_12960 [Kribbella sp. NPDC051586]|uniref:hypothetical protein n=1 Tax=Kribbella sp. NPDC051586 TaxID=3364118 RepID=UPI00379D5912